jgi:DNA-binding MarR family transcriptional regulator
MDVRQEHTLAVRLKTCGRFLFYQVGGKAGQQRILMTLHTLGHMTQKELQDRLEISSGALSEILQKMEDSSLIARSKSADDKRQVDLTLSPHGNTVALQVKENYHQSLTRIFECFDDAQRDQLEELLGILTQHLDELKADPLFTQTAEALSGCAQR